MFERNRIDNALQQLNVPAEVILGDGTLLKGKFVITAARPIYEVLNGETKFLEFETYGGEKSLIAKSTIASINLVNVPAASGLRARLRDDTDFDPHAVLGLAPGATWEQVRANYLKFSKSYHPDLFSSVALPDEVRDYLAAMARRINAAYRALEEPQQVAKRGTVTKAAPIFTSQPRA